MMQPAVVEPERVRCDPRGHGLPAFSVFLDRTIDVLWESIDEQDVSGPF